MSCLSLLQHCHVGRLPHSPAIETAESTDPQSPPWSCTPAPWWGTWSLAWTHLMSQWPLGWCGGWSWGGCILLDWRLLCFAILQTELESQFPCYLFHCVEVLKDLIRAIYHQVTFNLYLLNFTEHYRLQLALYSPKLIGNTTNGSKCSPKSFKHLLLLFLKLDLHTPASAT